MEETGMRNVTIRRVQEQIEKLCEVVEVEKAQSLLIFFDIQDFCFRKRKHDPSKSARTLADIEQNDKTVFFDAPGGVVDSSSPRRKKSRLGPNDINPEYLNVNIDEEGFANKSPVPNLILAGQPERMTLANHNSVLRAS